MDYEKKYKDALEMARDYYKANLKLDKADENLVLEDIFPELKESDGERIRKCLIGYFMYLKSIDKNVLSDITNDNILDWLEKRCTVIKDTISMDVNSETEWDDIYKFLRMNLNGEKVKLLIIREE